MIKLSRVCAKHNVDGEIYAKIEYYSPGLSKKDRIAKYMIEHAEAQGLLKPGQTVIEATSGNTGIGLAAVCAIKGYPFVAVMSAGNSPQRVLQMEAFGASVDLVPQGKDGKPGMVSNEDLQLVSARFEQLAKEIGAFKVGQFYNEANAKAHCQTTGQEIITQLPDVDVFLDFVGTGGTFEGVARQLKQNNKNIQCIKVLPTTKQHIIQGGGYFHIPPFDNPKHCDQTMYVSSEDATHWAAELALTEAIAGGPSSGANLCAAINYLKENPGKRAVILINDHALKYQ